MVVGDTDLLQQQQQQQQAQQQASEIYKKALTFNVIAKYDPLINQLLHVNSYCVIYKFDIDSNDWLKLDYQGPLGIYSRSSKSNSNSNSNSTTHTDDSAKFTIDEVLKDDELYTHGLIVLNRNKPLNFTIGLIGDKKLSFGNGDETSGIIVEQNGDLIIIKTLDNETFGIWIFDQNDRDYIFKILKYCID